MALSVWIPLLVAGCSVDSILKSDELPADVTDPALTRTREGALAAYHGTIMQFRNAFGGTASGVESGFAASTGLLSDELQWGVTSNNAKDMRNLPEGSDDAPTARVYSELNRVRAQAGQAIELLTRYAPGTEALRGQAYTLKGYAEVFLADLFCSGIPLSTLDFDGDFTYRSGSTTEEVYSHALALFDTALTLVGDSTRFLHLARMGQSRARLALGDYASSAAAAADVPDGYRYMVSYHGDRQAEAQNFATLNALYLLFGFSRSWNFTVADREGVNGLDYVSSGDPRTQVTSRGANGRGPVRHPNKYAIDGSSAIVLASGVEARLIEAEAALQAGNVTGWLAKLNHLRRTAIAPALGDLSDPGDQNQRVDLLFRERAFWLFLTGQRQGDLRRLVRLYGRAQEQLYPTGAYAYPNTVGLSYGSDVDVPIPPAERTLNLHFTGCAARGA